MTTKTHKAPATQQIGSELAEPPAVGTLLAALRVRQRLSLDDLSRRAGVSKSMLSQIERAQANPTVAVVWRLSQALGVPIGDLLGASVAKAELPAIEWVSAHATPAMGDAEAGVSLRILGPIDLAGRFEWYQLILKPGAELASQAHDPGSREHLTVQSGALDVAAAGAEQRVKAGETARYAVDVAHAIRNRGRVAATAVLAVVHRS